MQTYLVLSFLNPSILWGLFAISIPIIIHLFNLRRVKKVEFSNIDLLKRVKEETSSKKRPVEILILICRILFVGLLILSFAQPVFKDRDNALELDDTVLIYLDNSMSMGRSAGTQSSAFDMAYNFANTIVNAYPDNAKFKLIENNYSNSLSVNYSKESIKDRLTELSLASVGRSLEEVDQRLSSADFKGDIYLISDFQKRAKESLEKVFSDTLKNYYLVPVSVEGSNNLFFDSAYLENSFLLGELKNQLKVSVRNNGTEAVNDVNLRLFLNNQLTSTALLNVDPNTRVVHSFEIDRNATGLDRARITLEDAGADFDNELFLTLNNIEKVNVFEIRDANSGRYISDLYGDNELFNYEAFTTGNIDLNKLVEADIIILNEIENFSNQLMAATRDFIEQKGTIVIIPSRSLSPATYNDLGLRVTNDSRQRIQLSNPDLENPFFTGIFEETDEQISMPEATTLLRLRNAELSLLDFTNGRSFLSKVSTQGEVYFFSSAFDDDLTSFANHSLFVPVMYKLALGSKVNLSRLYYSTSDEAVLYPVDGQNPSAIVKLNKGDEELTPDQRYVGANLIMETPKDVIKQGHYEIKANEARLGTIAFNLPKEESESLTFSEEEFEAAIAAEHVSLIEATDAVGVEREISAGIKGVSLWKYALMLALLFLFLEIILIRYL